MEQKFCGKNKNKNWSELTAPAATTTHLCKATGPTSWGNKTYNPLLGEPYLNVPSESNKVYAFGGLWNKKYAANNRIFKTEMLERCLEESCVGTRNLHSILVHDLVALESKFCF